MSIIDSNAVLSRIRDYDLFFSKANTGRSILQNIDRN